MEAPEAIDLLSKLQAAYPGRDFTGDTGALYVELLMGFETKDVADSIGELILESVYPPSLAELNQRIREKRILRLELERSDREDKALYDWGRFVVLAPAEVREALRPYWERFGGRETQDLRLAAASGDTAARLEAGRRLAAAMIADDEAEGQLKPLPTPGIVGRSSCGVAWGTPGDWDEQLGLYVCPNCRSPIRDGCNSSREESA